MQLYIYIFFFRSFSIIGQVIQVYTHTHAHTHTHHTHTFPWWLRRCTACSTGFNPWIRKMPWRMEWQPTPLFLPGEFHGQRSLVGYNPWGCKELDTIEQLTHSHKHTLNIYSFKGSFPLQIKYCSVCYTVRPIVYQFYIQQCLCVGLL